ITYPKKEEEKVILRQQIGVSLPKIEPIIKLNQILHAREVVKEVYIDEKIENYITDIVFSTRYPEENRVGNLKPYINYGASPRATINLALASRAYAFIKRRGYVIPEDVRAICLDVMRHRIGLTYEAEADNITTEEIINEIINKVDVP
ncbi:MAG: MoxR family ATPase, partial [Bacteroidales bacterium]|nr:MoxR family ATPase [Bacteroidales bacterium]